MMIGKTLLECLEGVEDPRADYNRRHNFLDIMAIAILSVISGADIWDDMENWGHAKKEWLESFLELPNGIPSHDTFNRVFSMIKPEQFHKVFIEWVEAVTEKIEGVVAIDGKTVRRSMDGSSGKRAIHVVSAWAVENGIVLGQCRTEEKSNEITAIPELLKQLELKRCIVTIDAMGTQTKIAETIISQEADYILQVKENQPRLYEDISLYFKEGVLPAEKKAMAKKGCYYKEYSGEHGRIEEREYYVEHDIEWMEQKKDWKGLQGIGMCHTKVEKGGETTESYSYAIFSKKGMSAEEFGKGKRKHWKIENALHWVLDIAYREDESRARKGNSADA